MSSPRLHLLARAVIEHDGHVLLAQARGHTNTFLPGGHIEPGEGLKRCLARELFEETGLDFSVGAFLGVVEHEWRDKGGHPHHEINHLFAGTQPSSGREGTGSSPDLRLGSPQPTGRQTA